MRSRVEKIIYIWFFVIIFQLLSKRIQYHFLISCTQRHLLTICIFFVGLLLVSFMLYLRKAHATCQSKLITGFELSIKICYIIYFLLILLYSFILILKYICDSKNLVYQNIFELLSVYIFNIYPAQTLYGMFKGKGILLYSNKELLGVVLNIIIILIIFMQNEVNLLSFKYDMSKSLFYSLFLYSIIISGINFIFFLKNIKLFQEVIDNQTLKDSLHETLMYSFINYSLVLFLGLLRFMYRVFQTPIIGYSVNNYSIIRIEDFIFYWGVLIIVLLVSIFLIKKYKYVNRPIFLFLYGFLCIFSFLIIRPIIADFLYLDKENPLLSNFFYKHLWITITYIFN